jgi:hypothetical protein
MELNLNPAIWETIAGTGWRTTGRDAGIDRGRARENAGRMPALPLKTRGSCGHGAQQCCARKRLAMKVCAAAKRLGEGGAEAADYAILA